MLTQQELHELNQAQEQINQHRAEMFGQSQRQSLKTNSANPGNLKATPTSTQCSAVKQPEPLNKVLAVIKSNEPEAAKYNPPAPVKCEYCGALRYTSGIVLKDHVLWAPTGPEACKCEKAQAAKAAAAEIRRAQEEAAAAAERAEQERERIKRIIGASGVVENIYAETTVAVKAVKGKQSKGVLVGNADKGTIRKCIVNVRYENLDAANNGFGTMFGATWGKKWGDCYAVVSGTAANSVYGSASSPDDYTNYSSLAALQEAKSNLFAEGGVLRLPFKDDVRPLHFGEEFELPRDGDKVFIEDPEDLLEPVQSARFDGVSGCRNPFLLPACAGHCI